MPKKVLRKKMEIRHSFDELSRKCRNFLEIQSRKQKTLFKNSRYPLTYKPFYVTQGVVLALVFFALFVFLMPGPKVDQSLVIDNAILKQSTAAVAGADTVKWSVLVKKSDITQDTHLLELPKSARNIKVSSVSSQQAETIISSQKPDGSQTLSLIQKNKIAKANQPKRFIAASLMDSIGKFFFASLKEGVQTVSDAINPDIEETKDAKVVDLLDEKEEEVAGEPLEGPTLQEPVEEIPVVEETPVEEPAFVEDSGEEEYVQVTYETPAPEITEKATDTGKLVTVSTASTVPTVTSAEPAVITVLASDAPAPSAPAPTPEPEIPADTLEDILSQTSSEETDILEVVTESASPIISQQEDTLQEATPSSVLSVITESAASISKAFTNWITSVFTKASKFFTAAVSEVINLEPEKVLTTINISPKEVTLVAGGGASQQLEAQTLDQNGEPITANIYWHSSDTSIATVTSTGLVRPTGEGTANITVSNEQVQLTDVLASTKIPEIFKVGQEDKIKIKWKSEDNREVAFNAYDTDNNGKLDYVEWTVPHLSEQIFEIIFVSKAFQLDQNQEIVADIYDQVILKDDNWAQITDGQYVRATFEGELSSINDITIYARPTDVRYSAVIDVYPVYKDADGNPVQGDKITSFEAIGNEGSYMVMLTGLQTPTDTFDLRIGGNVDIDFIVDPSSLGNGLVAHYKMNDNAASTTVIDSIGGLNGTAQQNTSSLDVTGKVNGALTFNGSSDYILKSSTNLEISNAWTLSAWISWSADGTIISLRDPATAANFVDMQIQGTGVLETKFYKSDASGYIKDFVGSTDMSSGAWYHIIATWDGTDLKMFVNNVEETYTKYADNSGSQTNTSRPIYIGASGYSSGSNLFTGSIDDVRVYNRALSNAEIGAVYNLGNGTEDQTISLGNHLIAHYKMNDNAASTTVVDSIGGLNGTAQANTSTKTTTGKINSALTFNGSSDYISNSLSLNSSDTISMNFWIKADSVANTPYIINSDLGNNGILFYSTSSNGLFIQYQSKYITYTQDLTDGWHMLTFVMVSGSSPVLYVDNVLVTPSGSGDNGTVAAVAGLKIGTYYDLGNYFDGSFDDFRLYDKALTFGEVQALYETGSGTEDQTVSLSEGLVSHWRMNDNAGNTTVIDDMATNNGTAAANTSTKTTTGKINTALTFNGSSDYINLGQISETAGIGQTSYSFWMKNGTTGVAGHMLGDYSYLNGQGEIFYFNSDNVIKFLIHDGSNYPHAYATAATADTNWHHVVGTYQANVAIKLYIDGVLQTGESTATGGNLLSTYNTYIGADTDGDNFFNGTIDDVRIYNRALSLGEVSALYNSGSGTEEPLMLLGDDLIAHWKLNDNAANTTVAESMNNYTGTAQANTSTKTTTGKLDKALTFDGSSDYISAGAIDDLKLLNTDYTISVWVNLSAKGYLRGIIRSAGNNGDGYGYYLRVNHADWGSLVNFWYGYGPSWQNYTVTSTTALPDSEWTHLLVVHRLGVDTRLYVNGSLEDTESTPSAIADYTPDFRIGDEWDDGGQRYFSGSIDDVRIYKRALTEDQIAVLYSLGSGTEGETISLDNGLVSHYKMNDSAANTNVNETINGYTGTAQANTSTLTTTGKVNGALTFNGSSDYVTATTLPFSSLTSGAISFWGKTSSLDGASITMWDGSTNGIGFWGYDRIYINNAAYFSNARSADNAWHHYVVTWNGTTTILYKDGSAFGSPESVSPTMSSVTTIGIGTDSRNPGNYSYNGSIDDVRVYNRILSQAEVTAIYNGGSGTEAEGIVGEAPAVASNTAPSAPTLVSPATGSYTTDTTPTLSANYSDSDTGDTGTTSYRISSSSLADCTSNANIVASGASSETSTNSEATTWTPGSSIGSDATYYWCAQNNDGTDTSSWAEMGTFILDANAPSIAYSGATPANSSYWGSTSATVAATTSDSNGEHAVVNNWNSSLVSWWRMEDNAGNATVDDYIGSNNGTAQQNTSAMSTSGKYGNALTFNGSSDYVQVGNVSALKLTDTDFTISTWVKPTEKGYLQGILTSNYTSGDALGYHLRIAHTAWGKKAYFYFAHNTNWTYYDVESTSQIPDGSWTNIVVVGRKNNDLRIFINGSLEDTASTPNSYYDYTPDIRIGDEYNDGGERRFYGKIDDVQIYTRALSTDEISALYNANATQYTNTFTGLSNGSSYTFQAYAQDLAGNIADAGSRTFTVDTTNPSIAYSGSTPSNNSYQSSTSATVATTTSDANGQHSVVNNWNSSLVGWWRMNGDLTDSSGNGYNGTNNGATLTSSGKLGQAYSFTNGNYVTTTTPSLTSNFNMTVGLWYKASDPEEGALIEFGSKFSANSIAFINRPTYSDLILYFFDGSNCAVGLEYDQNIGTDWHHLAFTIDSSTDIMHIFIDGSDVASTDGNCSGSLNIGSLKMGRSSQGATGIIDDVQYYNRILSTGEIQALYNANSTQYTNSFTGLSNGSSYTFQAYTQDLAGNIASESARTFTIDSGTPDIVAVDAGASSGDRTSLTSGSWFKYTDTGSDDQVSFSWTDPSSASDDTFYYELNASSGSTVTGDESTTTNAYIDSITVTEGTNYFHVRPKNGAGTWGTERTFTVDYDKTNPTVTVTSPTDGTYYTNTSVSFAASQSDTNAGFLVPNLDSSLVSWWRMEDNAPNTTITDYMGNYNGTSSANTSTLSINGKFGRGLYFGSSSTANFKITALPTQTANSTYSMWAKWTNASRVYMSEMASVHSWYNIDWYWLAGSGGKIEVESTCEGDSSSTMLSTRSGLNDGQWHHIVFVFNSNGFDTYIDGIFDNNKDLGCARDINVNPSWSFGANINGASEVGGDDYWDDIAIFNRALTADEITALYNGTAISHSSTLTEASHTYKAYSSDLAGNVGTSSLATFTVDATAPAGGSITYTNGYYTTASVPITYSTGTDSVSGLATATGKIQRAVADLSAGTCGSYSAFADLVTEFDGSYTDTTVTTGHCYKYQYLIQDVATNQATYTSANVAKVDTAGPSVGVTTTSGFTTSGAYIKGTGTIVGGTATDATSGIDNTTCEYTVDGGSNWSSGSWNTDHCEKTSVAISNGTSYTFNTRVKDNAVNQGTGTATSTYTGDTTAPSTTDDVPSTWQSTNVTVTLTCDDGVGSGCSKVYYTTNGNDPTTGSSYVDASSSWQFTQTTEGVFVVKYRGEDALGNLEDTNTASNSLRLDKTTASTTDNVPSAWQTANVTITLTCSDGSGSGCSRVYYTVDGTAPTTGSSYVNSASSWQFTHTTETTGATVKYFSVDVAGNEESVKTAENQIKLDKTPPTLVEVTAVTTPATLKTPSYTFSSSEAGTITYAGSCASTTTTASQGNNTITFNELTSGTYSNCTITVTDTVGNVSDALSVSAFTITSGGGGYTGSGWVPPSGGSGEPSQPDTGSLIQQIQDIANQITNIFTNNETPAQPPVIPQQAPLALQGIDVLTVNPLGGLKLNPIRSDIAFYVSRIAQLRDMLNALGIDINQESDLEKLSQADLHVPGLSQTLTYIPGNIQTGEVQPFHSIPLVDLSASALAQMPTDIVFAKMAGGLIDVSSLLPVDKQGNTQQIIKVVSGKQVDLVIKPSSPASNITGFVVFKKSQQDISGELGSNVFKLLGAALSAVTSAPAPQGSEATGLLVQKFAYQETKPGVFTASITAPQTAGEYEIESIIEYKDVSMLPAEIRLTAIVDPEGYVYEQTSRGKLRIANAVVSIYWLNPETNQYELWPAENFLQNNPVTTDDTGRYSFLVPFGTYYLQVKARGYADFKGELFNVKQSDNIVINIGLEPNNFLFSWLTWQIAIIVILLVIIALVVALIYKKIKKNG